ncbi:hypothetical protein [Pseudomonas sp.]|uniref:hypothetical protein n=1 Tax=Pseudomonas sp. TaxID=306 RepID=UPI002585FF1C|nr:hypothetical protein [Pseudomonas sp.]
MIDLDEIERRITNFGSGVHGDIAIELISRLRQAEKDAARYRWLRDESAFTHENAPLTFFTDTNGHQIAFYFNGSSYSVLYDEMLDAAIDEAMQCK